GAKIFLDGKDTGKVPPAVLEDLPLSQNFHIGLQLEKHRPIEKPVTIYSIEPLNFNEKLEEILYGPIRVTSSPSGARVYLDNKDTGLSTPATLAELEVGKNYTVRLARQGYREVVRSVELSGKQGAAVSEKLLKIDEKTPQEIAEQKLQELERQKELQRQKERKTKEEPPTQAVADTYLSLSSNPKGADVFINGVRKGNTPGRWKVAAASPLEITLSKSGFSSVTKVVTLRPGETRNLGTLNLGGGSSTTTSPISTTGGAGIIVIDSNPPGALVLLNGAPQKTTPVRIKGLRPSTSHTITVKKDGYQTWSTSFTVTGDGKSFMANLKKL
ncbi:MAG TPA: hypothetical protein DF383_12530, partial [Deltaproteobacteria bacterium]|nr:hypothetical protein [Deltaproteobacteria bacterium]